MFISLSRVVVGARYTTTGGSGELVSVCFRGLLFFFLSVMMDQSIPNLVVPFLNRTVEKVANSGRDGPSKQSEENDRLYSDGS